MSKGGGSSGLDTAAPPKAGRHILRDDPFELVGPRVERTCAACSTVGTTMKTCTGCAITSFCGRECQAAAWKEHKVECKKTRILDVYTACPLFGAACTVARMNTIKNENHPSFHQVESKEMHGLECHLTLGPNRGTPSDANEFDMCKPTQAKCPGGAEVPKGAALSKMVLSDGDSFEAHVGVLLGFHNAVMAFNDLNKGKKRLQLAYKGSRIIEYGVCVGSHRSPDFNLIYHYPDGRTERRQDPDRHCWLYFSSERKDCVYADCCVFPFGFLGAYNAAPYVRHGGDSEAEQVFSMMAGPAGRAIAPMLVLDRAANRQLQEMAAVSLEQEAAEREMAHMLGAGTRVVISDVEWDEATTPSYVDYVNEGLRSKLAEAAAAAGPVRRPGQDRVLDEDASLDTAIEYYMMSEQLWQSSLRSEHFKTYPRELEMSLFVMS
ncbi:hypothetical protein FOA52_003468 [Chlamydomonas sp. UWO 241]|nr:hypothetical protein FOA52_003468 [Chlamydomonas sp. UWO 241]